MAQVGALFAGEVSGHEVVFPEQATQDTTRMGCFGETEATEPLLWDDLEEQRYREWLKMEMEKRDQAEFNEFDDEVQYRRKMREEAEQRGKDQVNWEDEKERMYRQKYQSMREKGELVWDCSGEREAQERARARTEARRKQPVQWDDQDERACMEMYRKKYGK